MAFHSFCRVEFFVLICIGCISLHGFKLCSFDLWIHKWIVTISRKTNNMEKFANENWKLKNFQTMHIGWETITTTTNPQQKRHNEIPNASNAFSHPRQHSSRIVAFKCKPCANLEWFFFLLFTPQFTDYVSFAKDSHIHKIYLTYHVCAFLFDLCFGKNVNFCYLLIFIVYIIFRFFFRVDSQRKKNLSIVKRRVYEQRKENKFNRRLNPANELERNDKKSINKNNKNEWCIKSSLPSSPPPPPTLLLLLLPLQISFTCSQFIHSMYAFGKWMQCVSAWNCIRTCDQRSCSRSLS